MFCLPTAAVLGGDTSSVQSDQIRMKSALQVKRVGAYDVHELRDNTGTAVREYVSPAGKVFAVAWEGRWLPDLAQLLGPYFSEYTSAQDHRQGHGPLILHRPGLIVQSAGHMRSFVGRAYLPDQVPQGMRVDDIR